MTDAAPHFINRELSWLEFNQRVLGEAWDDTNPLLERLKFLAISASNLDEFVMVRVGGLQLLAERGTTQRDPAGLTAAQQLEAIGIRMRAMVGDQYRCYRDELEPLLAEAGVRRIRPEELSDRQRTIVKQVFNDEILTIVTPIAVSLDEDFPLLANRTLSVCVQLDTDSTAPHEPRFAVIPIGSPVSRIVTLPSEGGYEYILVEDVIGMFVDRFFPGEPIVEAVPFRITRNADMSLREDAASDLLAQMEEFLDERRLAACVRLELSADATPATRGFLQQTLCVSAENIYAVDGPLDCSAFMQITAIRGFESLRNEIWPPRPSPDAPPQRTMFDAIAEKDVLLYHPYESFEPVVRLIDEAAQDPDVLAIKQTLYRTSSNSPIIGALCRASENGKYVTAVVELKARFDEARNIEGARSLENAGAQVIYGVKGLKTHSKICVIVRREPHGIQRYVHFGTGNYNEATARIYSDVSYMTCSEEFGVDASSFFNAITGYSQPQQYRRIEAAPTGLRDRVLEMIHAETERKRQGQQAFITAKVNSLVDPKIIDALYEASRAGVIVRLNVRGICCLRPGVPGLSENITVVSIIDRFLEHARIMHFHHGGDDRVFISSADWMPRNLDRRVELLVPVDNIAGQNRLIEILETYFRDNVKSHRLQADGSYGRVSGAPAVRSQKTLYHDVCQVVKRAEQSRRTVFEPHRAGQE